MTKTNKMNDPQPPVPQPVEPLRLLTPTGQTPTLVAEAPATSPPSGGTLLVPGQSVALVVDGGPAGVDIRVSGIEPDDTLVSVALEASPATNLTSACSISRTQVGAIQCSIDTTGRRLAIVFQKKRP